MKTKLTLILFALALTTSFAQTIRRVNADPTVTGTNVYTTIQAAHDAATAGDILIVEPGGSVGSLNCIKTLTIYGRGHYLDKNPNYSNLPNRGLSSNIASLSIYATNCKVSGLYIGSIGIYEGASGSIISRNFIPSGITISGGTGINNTTISQNSLMNSAIRLIAGTGVISNTTISNNLLVCVAFTTTANNLVGDGTTANRFSSTLINQNTMANWGGYGSVNACNALISNNIIYQDNIYSAAPNGFIFNSTFSNNVTFGTTTINSGLGANNIVIANSVGQFNSNTGGSDDNNYRVATGSAMKTASSSGGEVGMFGGATPYIQYGIPASPAIIKLLNTGIGNSTTPITATVSATSNN